MSDQYSYFMNIAISPIKMSISDKTEDLETANTPCTIQSKILYSMHVLGTNSQIVYLK